MTWQMANHVNGVWLKNDFQIQDDKIWEKHELERLPEVLELKSILLVENIFESDKYNNI